MARTKNEKLSNQKKTEIVKAAIGLITEEGYASFSLNKLLLKMDMPKGNFFHYYKSKKALMDSIFLFLSEKFIHSLRDIENHKTMCAKDKLVAIYHVSSKRQYEFSDQGEKDAQSIFSPKNKSFIEMVANSLEQAYMKIIEAILIEGQASGVFKIKNLNGSLKHIIITTKGMNKDIADYLLSEKSSELTQVITDELQVFNDIMGYLVGTEFDQPFYLIKGLNVE